ncbi:hypothetical protein [Stenotrophomonas nitritireducens]|uniref:hypothetical protein n=1 Tax=Stenotrophomonas nitritireducens TaxID=83617 RepID=UPI003D9733E3
MSGLAFAQAPSPSHPLRFLATALLWGALAGAWLLAGGDALLVSPHAPATIALAHVFALGVLGNAMLGSLVQFLPVAACSPLPLARGVPLLHAVFNLGVGLLLPAIAGTTTTCGLVAAPLLVGALASCACAVLVAVVRGSGARAVRCGIGLAATALLATIGLGAALLAMRLGWMAPTARPLLGLHASFGLLGWVLGLLAAVGTMVVPMLQGTRPVPSTWLWGWLVLLAGVLLAAGADGVGIALPLPLPRIGPMLPLLLFAAAVIVLQQRAPHRRGPLLRRFWALGSLALAAATLVMPLPGSGLLAGVLVLAVGFPALVLGMLMEIAGFLAWIELRRRLPRGTRVPGVGSLFAEPHKRRVWWLHAVAALSLVLACLQPELARIAGALVLLGWLGAAWALWRCWRSALAWRP